jgi:hypothetical protein
MNKSIADIRIKNESEIYRAERLVEEVCDYYHIGSEYFANVMLGTTEAIRLILKKIQNTGEHLTVTAEKNNKGLHFILKGGDAGNAPGMDSDPLEQAIEKERLSRELFIIRSLADETRVSKDGRAISLVFNITSLDAERSLSRVGQLKEYYQRKAVKIKKSDA